VQASIGFLHAEDAIGTGLVARSCHHIGRGAGKHPKLHAPAGGGDAYRHQRKSESAAIVVRLHRAAQMPRLHRRKAQACGANITVDAEQRQRASGLGVAHRRDIAALGLGNAIELVGDEHAGQADGKTDEDFDDGKTSLRF